MRLLVVLAVVLLTTPAWGETFGPYLGAATTDAVTVAWRTNDVGDSVVEFDVGPSPTALTRSQSDAAMVVQHELRLTGLMPNTNYTYRVRSTANGQTIFESGPHTFRTAAGPRTPFRFVFFGEVHQNAYITNFDPVVSAFDPSFQVQVGDNVDDAGMLDQWQNFFTQGSWYASVPLFTTFGNHNYHNDDGGLFPENTDAELSLELVPPHARWHTFRYGDAQFFALDSTHYLSDEVRDNEPAWFDQALAEARDGVDDPALLIAFFHIPVYSSCGDLSCRARRLVENPWVARELISRINQYGVHLVLNGHDKINEHSIVDGVHYLQTTSGASPRDLGSNNAGSQWADADDRAMARLTVDGCVASFDFVRADGTVLHTGTVTGDCDLLPVDADMDGATADVDCDDDDRNRFPGNTEVCGDGIDQDCSGADIPCDVDAGVMTDAAASPLDAGTDDAGSVVVDADAGAEPATDAGTKAPDTLDTGEGCGCTASGRPAAHSALVVVLVVVVLALRPSRNRRETVSRNAA